MKKKIGIALAVIGGVAVVGAVDYSNLNTISNKATNAPITHYIAVVDAVDYMQCRYWRMVLWPFDWWR